MHNWLSSQRASAKCDGKANLQIIFSPATIRRNLGAVKRCTQFIWLWKILCFCSKHEHSSFLQKNQNQRCTQVCRSENAWRGRGLIASWNMPVLSVSQSFCLHRVFAQHPHASGGKLSTASSPTSASPRSRTCLLTQFWRRRHSSRGMELSMLEKKGFVYGWLPSQDWSYKCSNRPLLKERVAFIVCFFFF